MVPAQNVLLVGSDYSTHKKLLCRIFVEATTFCRFGLTDSTAFLMQHPTSMIAARTQKGTVILTTTHVITAPPNPPRSVEPPGGHGVDPKLGGARRPRLGIA